MTIFVTLSPELELLLYKRATQSGQDVSFFASELLANALAWEEQDSQEAVSGIQQGLQDFDTGKSRSFDEFAEEQRRKYNLADDE
jgi:hypothetical protein